MSIRQQVFSLLDKNTKLTTKKLCELLHLDYHKHRQYVWNLRSLYKTSSRFGRASKCSSVHGWRGWCRVPNGLDRLTAVEKGWIETKSRNRFLLWRNRKLGRLMWFETGRVNVYVCAPASVGKAYQLIVNAFSRFTSLITDVNVLQSVIHSFKFKGAHYVFETDHPLPKFTIAMFDKTNGVTVKLGDVSHPRAVEMIVHYPDWSERNERLLEQILEGKKGRETYTGEPYIR